MIITDRTARLSYSTDTIAESVRILWTAPVAGRADRPRPEFSKAAILDPGALYPSLYGSGSSKKIWMSRIFRAVAVRLSILGSTATIFALLQR